MKYTTVYKLTTEKSTTRPGYPNETQWGEGITHTAPGGGEMCSANWIHAYSHPFLAVLLNATHANYNPFQLWKCRAIVGIREADKIGCTELTTLQQIPVPAEFMPTQRSAFAILVARRVYKDKKFTLWAKNWLNGKDRTAKAADAAAKAACAAYAAAYADAYVAYAAKAAAKAAKAAYAAAYAADAYADAYVADAAKAAAYYATTKGITDKQLLCDAKKALKVV